MEQLEAMIMAYSSWIFWGIVVLNLILLTAALHRMRKLRKQMKLVSQDVKKLLEIGGERQLESGLHASAGGFEDTVKDASKTRQINERMVFGALASGESIPVHDYIRGGRPEHKVSKEKFSKEAAAETPEIPETPEKLLNAVLEEVFP